MYFLTRFQDFLTYSYSRISLTLILRSYMQSRLRLPKIINIQKSGFNQHNPTVLSKQPFFAIEINFQYSHTFIFVKRYTNALDLLKGDGITILYLIGANSNQMAVAAVVQQLCIVDQRTRFVQPVESETEYEIEQKDEVKVLHQ